MLHFVLVLLFAVRAFDMLPLQSTFLSKSSASPAFWTDELHFPLHSPSIILLLTNMPPWQGQKTFLRRQEETPSAQPTCLVPAIKPSSNIAPSFASSSAFSLPSVINFSESDIRCLLPFQCDVPWTCSTSINISAKTQIMQFSPHIF